MENQQYPGNSDKALENPQQPPAQKRVSAPVINGGAQVREKTAWNAIEDFFGLGECHSFRDYVSALSDMTNRVYGAIDTLLGNRKYQNSTMPAARIAYSQCYPYPQQPAQPQNPVQPQGAPGIYGQNYIIYDNRQDAELVLVKMLEMLQIYHNVSIGDMFDLAGISDPNGYTGMNWGWRDGGLNGVHPVPFGSKWVLNLPPVVPLRT